MGKPNWLIVAARSASQRWTILKMHLSTTTYFEHYEHGKDLSPSGRKRLWHEYRTMFAPLLPSDRNSRILDFGCGAGLLLEWLKSVGYSAAEGIDTDPGQIKFADGLNVNAHLVADSFGWLRHSLPFDAIVMSDVLEHIGPGDDLRLLSAAREALKETGVLVLRVPNASSPFGTRLRYIDPTHHRSYTELSLRYDLVRAGFRDIQIFPAEIWRPRNAREAITIVMKFFFRWFHRLEAISEFGLSGMDMPLSFTFLAVAHR